MATQISFDKGWVQRIARHLFPPGSLVDAINVTPDELGALTTRPGHTLLGTTGQPDCHSLWAMYTANGTRVEYQGANGVLYRDFISLITGLNGTPIEFASLRGNQEQVEYTYFANGQEALRVKDDGTTVTRWGIAAPTAIPVAVVGAIKTQTVEQFNAPTVAVDFVATGATLTRDLVNKQEGASALSMSMVAGATGIAKKVLGAPLNLAVFSDGSPSTTEDGIRFWLYVAGTANFVGAQLAVNFSAGTQFIDGYFISQVDLLSFFSHTDGTWAEVSIAKQDFLRVGSAAGDWNAINGILLQGIATGGGPVTLLWDDMRVQGGYRIGEGLQSGTYRYKQAFIRKAVVASHVGRYVNGTATYTDQTGGTLELTSATNNDGHFVGGDAPFAEIIYVVSQATVSAGTVVYEYAYWAGAWVVFTPDETSDFSVLGTTRVTFSFPAGPWQKAVPTGVTFMGLANAERYWIRVRATTAPTITAGWASSVRIFDSVVAARGNGSPASVAVAVQNRPVTVTVTNPLAAGADQDAQITHVEIYRTVANDTADDAAPLLLDGDVPAGKTTFVSSQADVALGDILELDNDRPPAFTALMEHQQRIFGLANEKLYFSKINFPESFPPTNYIPISSVGDTPLQVRQYDGVPYVWTLGRVFQILGADETTYFARPIQCPTGLGAAKSVERGERGIYFLGRDGNLWRISGSTAMNISDENHYQLFHGITQNGIAPLTLSETARATCVAAWHNFRLYLTYPSGVALTPNATLVIDELTQTWWRDSRALRCLHADRRGNRLLGSRSDNGQVFQLDNGTTDNGTPIAVTMQTRDEDEQAFEHDKELVQCTIDAMTAGSTLTVQAVVDYVSSGFTALGTAVMATRQERVIGTTVGTPIKGKAIGYRLTGTGPLAVYRLIPHVLILPAVLTSYRSLPLDLGYPGAKLLESLLLDLDLQSGIMTVALYADGLVVQTTTYATIGRVVRQIVESPLAGTVFQVGITCTGLFLLYPGTTTGWLPKPQVLRTYRTLPMDLGYPGPKILESLTLDIDLLAGSLTTALIVDGVTQGSYALTTLGRSLTQLLTTPIEGTLVEVLLSLANPATESFLLYPGTALGWLPKPAPVMKAYRTLPLDLGYRGPKILESFLLDVDLLSGVLTAQIYADGALSGTMVYSTLGRALPQLLTTTILGTLFEVRLTCTGTFLLYPETALGWVATVGPALRTYRTPALDLGYPGAKTLESLLLDIDLQSGVLSVSVFADGALADTLSYSTVGRHFSQLLQEPVAGILFEILMVCTGTFLLYPGCGLGWLPKPSPLLTHHVQPTDLGYPGVKNPVAFYLDIELLAAGMVTTTWYSDGVERHHVQHTEVGRVRSQRHRLPASMAGRLIAVDFASTAPFLLWPGTTVEWGPLGQAPSQHTALVGQVVPSQQIQTTPLMPLQMYSPTNPQIQMTPLLGQGMGGQIHTTPLLAQDATGPGLRTNPLPTSALTQAA